MEWLLKNWKTLGIVYTVIFTMTALISKWWLNEEHRKWVIKHTKLPLSVGFIFIAVFAVNGLNIQFREENKAIADAIVNQRQAVIQREEAKYWNEFLNAHNGIAVGPVKQGEQLIVNWDIMNRPLCSYEYHSPVVAHLDGKWIGQAQSALVLPRSEDNPYGRPLSRYRISRRDYSVSHFKGTGIGLPVLPVGEYLLIWIYRFEGCEKENPYVRKVVVTRPVRFKVIKK